MFKKWWPWISIGLIVTGSLLFLLGNRRTFNLQVDGSPMQVQSSAITTGSVLRSAGVEYSVDDRLQPAAFSLANSRTLIKLDHLRDIDLIINPGSTQLKVKSTERIPGNLALAAGILLFPKDSILAEWTGDQCQNADHRRR